MKISDYKALEKMIEGKVEISEIEKYINDIHEIVSWYAWARLYRTAIKQAVLELEAIHQNYLLGCITQNEYVNQCQDASLYQLGVLDLIKKVEQMDELTTMKFKGFYDGVFYQKD